MLKWLSSLFGKGERQETTIINFRLHRITEKHDQRIREALEGNTSLTFFFFFPLIDLMYDM